MNVIERALFTGQKCSEIGEFYDFFDNIEIANPLEDLTEISCKSGIYSERGPKGPDF